MIWTFNKMLEMRGLRMGFGGEGREREGRGVRGGFF